MRRLHQPPRGYAGRVSVSEALPAGIECGLPDLAFDSENQPIEPRGLNCVRHVLTCMDLLSCAVLYDELMMKHNAIMRLTASQSCESLIDVIKAEFFDDRLDVVEAAKFKHPGNG